MGRVVAHRGAARSFALMIPGTPSSSATVSPVRGGGWRAFSRSTLELAGMAGVTLRLYRAAVLSLDTFADWPVFIGALVVGVVFVCGVLTWHLSNFPLRRWPSRVAAFVGIEVAAEFGMSSVLIALRRERCIFWQGRRAVRTRLTSRWRTSCRCAERSRAPCSC
jgi:hypothetical protein